MREAFSRCLVNAAGNNKNLYLLTGDHGYALFDDLLKTHPDRFLNAGVAEQNMVGVGSGMAKLGFLPVIYGLSSFVPIRVLEQIKIDFCYENLPCILIGDGAGVVYSQLGSSHQSTEDIACLRALPNIRILSPADRFEMEACFEIALQANAPVYLRIGKSDLGDLHKEVPKISWGDPLLLQHGDGDIGFVATGSMVASAMKLRNLDFVDASVISVPSIKPLNSGTLIKMLSGKKFVFVLEEHSIFGGLGSCVAEIFAEHGGPRIFRLGINDRFSKMCGSYQYLMKEHSIDYDSLLQSVRSKLGSGNLD